MKVNSRLRSFGTALFSLTMTLNTKKALFLSKVPFDQLVRSRYNRYGTRVIRVSSGQKLINKEIREENYAISISFCLTIENLFYKGRHKPSTELEAESHILQLLYYTPFKRSFYGKILKNFKAALAL